MKTKKIFAILAALALTALTVTSCTESGDNSSKSSDTDQITVGVIQFGAHSSLDNCYTGIKEVLEAKYGDRLKIDHQDGNFEPSACDTIAKNMVAKNYDIIIPIATPAAVAAYSAASGKNTPVIFSAVSDPVSAGLVDSLKNPGGHSTGTSDILDLSAQLKLIRALQPNAKKIGVLYTTSETNSVSHLNQLKQLAPAENFEIVEQGVQTAADIPQALVQLIPKVDCLNNFTDNNVVNNLGLLLEKTGDAGIPIYGSEEEQVYKGSLGCVGLDYVQLGRVTGEMAIKVLGGEAPGTIAVRTITETTPMINTDVLSVLKLTIPEAYSNAVKVKTKKD